MSTNQPSQTNPRLTQIALAVLPTGMIADKVLPRVPVPAEQFRYTKFSESTFFNIPNTFIGRKSKPNEVEFGGTLVDDSTVDWGLSAVVPLKDIQNYQNGLVTVDPRSTNTIGTMRAVILGREQRVANFLFTLGNYASSLRTTLSGTAQWSDTVNSDPIGDIINARDSMIVKPNILVLGRKVASTLQRHPKVVAAILGNMGVGAAEKASGLISLSALAAFLELERIEVGESFFNSAKEGQAAVMARLWGNHASLLRIDSMMSSLNENIMPSFGVTAQNGSTEVRTVTDMTIGAKGAEQIIVVEQLKEIQLWQNAGFFFQNAVA